MTRLKAEEIRKLAWNDLAAKQYWPFVGGAFVLQLVAGAIAVVGILICAVPVVVMFLGQGGNEFAGRDIVDVLLSMKGVSLLICSCLASVPILYATGYSTWGGIRLSLAAAERNLKFEHCLSGWGHGWKMCWTVLVQLTYLQLWLLLLVVPGIVKLFSYVMTEFVQVEHPDWTANQCITESRRLMAGNRWRFFCLCFSFIGWFLLMIVAMVVIPLVGNFASYFFQPYFGTALARFYLEVKREKASGGVET